MPIRQKNSGLALLRRSSEDQPNSLQMQVEWAQTAADQEGVLFSGDLTDVDDALRDRATRTKSLRLDISITGADLTRPGLQAFINDAISDPTISHVFIHKRDRLARPDDPIEAILIERQLTAAGITIVFSNRRITPSPSGEIDLSASIMSLVDYHESGQFLKTHAERVLLTQRRLAEQGFWTGGRASYGFERALRLPNGEIEPLAPGRRVRQAGCHVIIVPHDWTKIAVWLRILDLADAEWGNKRIATLLGAEGIPSPDAGRTRRDHGVPHRVSGLWHANTVKHLIENRAILGILDYGRRSEGRHRRLSSDGTRALGDDDRCDDRRAKTILNDPSLIISAALPFDAQYDAEKWEGIQQKRRTRASSQRGVPRARDLGRYPLSGRTIDLTDGCGYPMYGRPHGKRSVLVCGRYMNSNGKRCNNNSVDAEAALTFALSTLRQIVAMHGGRPQIELLLRDRIRQPASSREIEAHKQTVGRLEAALAAVDEQIAGAQHRLATVADDLVEDVSAALRDLKEDRRRAEQHLAEERRRVPAPPADPEEEIQAAMDLLDQLEAVQTDSAARRELTRLLRKLNLWLGLEFTEAIKGKKRRVRRLVGGVLTFDEGNLPTPPFGRDRVPENDEGYDRSTAGNRPEDQKGGQITHAGEESPDTDTAHPGVGGETDNRREGVSFTKVIRGDWI